MTIDGCGKLSVLVGDNCLSSIDIVNCKQVEIQVMGVSATISLDKTDSTLYLSEKGKVTEIITSKSNGNGCTKRMTGQERIA